MYFSKGKMWSLMTLEEEYQSVTDIVSKVNRHFEELEENNPGAKSFFPINVNSCIRMALKQLLKMGIIEEENPNTLNFKIKGSYLGLLDFSKSLDKKMILESKTRILEDTDLKVLNYCHKKNRNKWGIMRVT